MTRAELDAIAERVAMEEAVRRDCYPKLLGLLHDFPAARARLADEAEGCAEWQEIMAQPDYEVRAATYRAIATDLRRDY